MGGARREVCWHCGEEFKRLQTHLRVNERCREFEIADKLIEQKMRLEEIQKKGEEERK